MSERTRSLPTTLASRLRGRLRSFEPMYLALLGLLAVPSYVFDSLAVLEVFELFFLFFLWPFVSPLVDLALRRGADEESEGPIDWIEMGSWQTFAAWILTMPLTFVNPLLLAQDLSQWLGTAVAFVRHRGTFPDAETYDQQASYRLPFDGTWTVVNGSYDRDFSHSWFPATQRYAYDFVITDDAGRTAPEESGSAVDGYYCYDEPILAPADGVVIDVFDSDFESPRGGGLSHPLKRDIRGCYVVLQHTPDEYSCLAHLVPGSTSVAPGERVRRGQEIGRCGHSGNSSEPHLHFQLQDHPRFEIAAGLPIAFDDINAEWPGASPSIADPRPGADDGDGNEHADSDPTDKSLEDGGENRNETRSFLSAGQRVTHVDRLDGDSEPNRTDRDEQPAERDADRAGSSSGDSAGLATLSRVAFGTCVGGVVAFFAPIVVATSAVAPLLIGGAALAAGWRARVVIGGDRYRRRPGGLGIIVGLGLVAAAVWDGGLGSSLGVGVQNLGALAFAVGFVGYALLGEYDRLRLREAFPDPAVSPETGRVGHAALEGDGD
ncbi:M23 family metallopeptidase [Natrinema versiforme]|uniref:Peptidase M23 n=1 Tax=Natrinema versiforme JCM 10478 TaxID=1227496 RepID=L9YBK9_9EURY|nr:M23 family metallopeptidase [Natrinema versiforme]ELY71001.1 Peptidase M23 [Natrinema versiforme JCM 10478]